jgi:hypothetical protein
LKIALKKILRKILRASRLSHVTKEMFPNVLKELWQSLRPISLVNGFRGASLCPFNPDQIDKRKFLPSLTVTKAKKLKRTNGSAAAAQRPPSISFSSSMASGLPVIVVRQIKPMSPKTAMRCSIEKCVLGPQQLAPEASKKRKKVQNFFGEVLTEESAMQALAEREMMRSRKKRRGKRSIAKVIRSDSRKRMRESFSPPVNFSESSDEEMNRPGTSSMR